MVAQCCAYGCNNKVGEKSGISFHTFPLRDKERLSKWVHNVRRAKWFPTKYSRLCSEHFTPDNYRPSSKEYPSEGDYKILKWNAVPTLFSHFKNTPGLRPQKPSVKRKTQTCGPSLGLRSRTRLDPLDVNDDVFDPLPAKVRKRAMEDHIYSAVEDEPLLDDDDEYSSGEIVETILPDSSPGRLKRKWLSGSLELQSATPTKSQTETANNSSDQVFKLTIKSLPGRKTKKGTGSILTPSVFSKAMEAALEMLQTQNEDGGIELSEHTDLRPSIRIEEVFSNYNHDRDGDEVITNTSPVQQKSPQRIIKFSGTAKENIISLENAKKSGLACLCSCVKCRSTSKLQARYQSMKKKLHAVHARLSRANKKVRKLIEEKEKVPVITPSQIKEELKRYLNADAYEFTIAQLRTGNEKPGHKFCNRWSPVIKDLILTVYRDSFRAYRMMKRIFELPSKSILVVHENQLKEMQHLDNELLFGVASLDRCDEQQDDNRLSLENDEVLKECKDEIAVSDIESTLARGETIYIDAVTGTYYIGEAQDQTEDEL